MTHSAPDTPAVALPNDLRPHLTPPARDWLDQALAEAAQGITPTTELHLAEAARCCGPPHADTARILILQAAHPTPVDLTRVYHRGTADERRAVLHALPHLVAGPDAVPLIEDALRTNDTRLLSAALGPYAACHLSAHLWRHAILKCLFTGVPVAEVAQLAARAHGDAELARMLADFAAERTAAGRPVPEDLHHVLALTDPEAVPPHPVHEDGVPHGKES
ncbi:EboA domain-containing protein [Streptomyces bauhiniae]|uniref:Sugar phosphate isomerase n=1 Tax=Streptomyces bauhiniae TaxID=2340725 RepID=A0A7K3QW54_9ACTN|nr:EboA domain-containing protein [Streptomyces bauhiniae]NEB94106.1 sugar phosphate isomerase [Streptomyces bauhiniae]